MANDANNIKMEPCDVYMGTTQVQIQQIICNGDTAAAPLNNKYFFFYDSAGAKRYAWFNVAAGGTDPAVAGYTAHAVAISALASASDVATALAAVLTAVTGFDATSSGYYVTLTATATGYATLAHDAQASAGKTLFAFSLTQVGDTYESMGYIDGDISVSGISRTPVDITTHQTGTSIVGQIVNGAGKPELSFALKEVTTAAYEKILRYTSGSYLPVGGSNKLIGGGSLGQFQSPLKAKVVLHPVRLSTTDKTNDYCFWSCNIDLESLNFSGEKMQMLPVKIKAFVDPTKPAAISVWSYGDWSQSLT
jgi:hypothetical protein